MKKSEKFKKIKCIESGITNDGDNNEKHYLFLAFNEENKGMFGSKIEKIQFEKVESVLSKRYIKLPFGIRILL